MAAIQLNNLMYQKEQRGLKSNKENPKGVELSENLKRDCQMWRMETELKIWMISRFFGLCWHLYRWFVVSGGLRWGDWLGVWGPKSGTKVGSSAKVQLPPSLLLLLPPSLLQTAKQTTKATRFLKGHDLQEIKKDQNVKVFQSFSSGPSLLFLCSLFVPNFITWTIMVNPNLTKR